VGATYSKKRFLRHSHDSLPKTVLEERLHGTKGSGRQGTMFFRLTAEEWWWAIGHIAYDQMNTEQSGVNENGNLLSKYTLTKF